MRCWITVCGTLSTIPPRWNIYYLLILFLNINTGDPDEPARNEPYEPAHQDLQWATKCYKNDVIGDRDRNIYYCNDDDQPECCEVDRQFTCCVTQAQNNMKEQLILWGSLAVVAMVIAIAVLYFWKDINCCNDDRPCQCCKKKDNEVATTTPDRAPFHAIPYPSTSSYRSWTPAQYDTPTPPPAYTYKG